MKLIAIEEKDIEIVYRFEGNVPEQMLDQDEDQKEQLLVRKNK